MVPAQALMDWLADVVSLLINGGLVGVMAVNFYRTARDYTRKKADFHSLLAMFVFLAAAASLALTATAIRLWDGSASDFIRVNQAALRLILLAVGAWFLGFKGPKVRK